MLGRCHSSGGQSRSRHSRGGHSRHFNRWDLKQEVGGTGVEGLTKTKGNTESPHPDWNQEAAPSLDTGIQGTRLGSSAPQSSEGAGVSGACRRDQAAGTWGCFCVPSWRQYGCQVVPAVPASGRSREAAPLLYRPLPFTAEPASKVDTRCPGSWPQHRQQRLERWLPRD